MDEEIVMSGYVTRFKKRMYERKVHAQGEVTVNSDRARRDKQADKLNTSAMNDIREFGL